MDFQTILVFLIAIIPYLIKEWHSRCSEKRILAATFISEIESVVERYRYAAKIFLEEGGMEQNL